MFVLKSLNSWCRWKREVGVYDDEEDNRGQFSDMEEEEGEGEEFGPKDDGDNEFMDSRYL